MNRYFPAFAASLAVAGAVHAQTPPSGTAPAATTVPATAPAAPTPKRTYLTLRADEDWRWLRNPPADSDIFDPVKFIPLNDEKDFSLTVGGSARLRYERKQNPGFGATNATNPFPNDEYYLHRYYLHFDLRYKDIARVFVEGKSAFIEHSDRNPPPTPVPSDDFDLHQGFVDISPWTYKKDGFGLTFRAGRQELLYDKQKLVGPLDWGNARRSFDGLKIMTQFEQVKIDAFWTKPVVIEAERFDEPDGRSCFAGVHAQRLMWQDHTLSVFSYYLTRNRDTRTTFGPEYNPDLKAGKTDRITVGAHFWGKTGALDYDIEGGPQFGHMAGDDILAAYLSAELGYTFDFFGKPRLSIGYDYASGDDNPGDGEVNTFDQLFPTGHLWFGYADVLGRQNINAGNVTLAFNPHPDVKVWGSWHLFCLADSNDAAYNVGGAPFRRSAGGNAGSYLGNEIDITVSWQIEKHTSLLAGYSWFMPGDFIENTGLSKDVHFIYAGVEFKF